VQHASGQQTHHCPCWKVAFPFHVPFSNAALFVFLEPKRTSCDPIKTLCPVFEDENRLLLR
jgi:hypothetical protein